MKTPDQEVYDALIDDMPQAFIIYYATDEDGTIQLANSLAILKKHGRDFNIGKMRDISSKEDFKFWLNSKEGKEFLETNRKLLNKVFTDMVLSTAGFTREEIENT